VDSKITSLIQEYIESAAPPIPLASVTRPSAAHDQVRLSAAIRHQVSRRRAVALVAAAASVAAAVTIGITLTGSGHARRSSEGTVLTAAMIHHVEAASQAAIAPAGHMLVSFSVGLMNRSPSSSGSVDYTFSGHDFNAIEHLPTSAIASKSQTLTIRQVNGQLYVLGPAPRKWYHLHGDITASRNVPDPRKLLTALRPDARFEDIGSQVIDGVKTTILRATQLSKLPASVLSSLTFVSSMGPESLTQFDIWVDDHGIVRQMKIIHQGRSPQGLVVETQTIRFLDIGKPETITAPPRYSNMTP
jgi:hypothetical protein